MCAAGPLRRIWRPADPTPPDHPDFAEIHALLLKTRDMFLDQQARSLHDVFIREGLVVSLIGGQAICGGAEAVLAAFDKASNAKTPDPSAVRDWAIAELTIGRGVAQAVIEASDPDARYVALAALCRLDAGWRVASVVFEMV